MGGGGGSLIFSNGVIVSGLSMLIINSRGTAMVKSAYPEGQLDRCRIGANICRKAQLWHNMVIVIKTLPLCSRTFAQSSANGTKLGFLNLNEK